MKTTDRPEYKGVWVKPLTHKKLKILATQLGYVSTVGFMEAMGNATEHDLEFLKVVKVFN